MNTIFQIFLYNFKSIFRNLSSTGIIFVLPIIFMGIFGVLLGGTTATNLKFSVGIYTPFDTPPEISQSFDLKKIFTTASDSSDNLELEVKTVSNKQELEDKIKNNQINVGLVLEAQKNAQPKVNVLTTDTDLNSSIRVSTIKEILTSVYFQGESPITTTFIKTSQVIRRPFDLLVPGLMIYGILNLMPMIAQMWTEIAEKKHILRYTNSKTASFELILGYFVFYIMLGLVQVAILYVTAQVFGYKPTGNLLAAFVPTFLTLAFVIGLGMMIGTFFKKTEPSNNTANILSVVLGFLSGSFISGIDTALKFKLFDRVFVLTDFVPTRWSTRALDDVLTRNRSLTDIQNEIIILSFSALFTVILAIWFYNYKRNKIE